MNIPYRYKLMLPALLLGWTTSRRFQGTISVPGNLGSQLPAWLTTGGECTLDLADVEDQGKLALMIDYGEGKVDLLNEFQEMVLRPPGLAFLCTQPKGYPLSLAKKAFAAEKRRQRAQKRHSPKVSASVTSLWRFCVGFLRDTFRSPAPTSM